MHLLTEQLWSFNIWNFFLPAPLEEVLQQEVSVHDAIKTPLLPAFN